MQSHGNELAIFQKPHIESGIVSEKYIEYMPISSISRGSIIEFSILNPSADYINLNKTRLVVKLRLTKSDGSPIKTEDKTALVTGILSCFRQIDILLNKKLVSPDISINLPYKALIDLLLNYGEDMKT